MVPGHGVAEYMAARRVPFEVRQQWLGHPCVLAGQQIFEFTDAYPPGIENDAIGIGDVQLAAPLPGLVNFDRQEPARSVAAVCLDGVQRAVPGRDPQAGFFGDLTRQCAEHGLAWIDHTAWCAPIGAAVAPPVVDHEHGIIVCEDAAGHSPSVHFRQHWRSLPRKARG